MTKKAKRDGDDSEKKLNPSAEPPGEKSFEQYQAEIRQYRLKMAELEMQLEHIREAYSGLERLEERQMRLFYTMPLPYLVLDMQGRIRQLNEAGKTLLGAGGEVLLGIKFAVFVFPMFQAIFYEHWKALLLSRKQQSCVVVLKIKDEFIPALLSFHFPDTEFNEVFLTISKLTASQ